MTNNNTAIKVVRGRYKGQRGVITSKTPCMVYVTFDHGGSARILKTSVKEIGEDRRLELVLKHNKDLSSEIDAVCMKLAILGFDANDTSTMNMFRERLTRANNAITGGTRTREHSEGE